MTYHGDAKRQYQLAWIAARRNEWIESQGGACVRCGSDEELEVDHVHPNLKICNPALIWSRNAEFRAMELAKCQVLCKACHRKKTNREMQVKQHGTIAMYNRGCRCDPCKRSNKERVRLYRMNKALVAQR